VSAEREKLVESFDQMTREREELLERMRRLEAEGRRYHELEGALTQAIVTAERQAADTRAQAGREAEQIVEDARATARKLVHDVETEIRGALQALERSSRKLEAEASRPPT